MRALGESQRKKRAHEDRTEREIPKDSYDLDFEEYEHYESYESYRTEDQQSFPETSRRPQESYKFDDVSRDLEDRVITIDKFSSDRKEEKVISKEKLRKSKREAETARKKRINQEAVLISQSPSSAVNLELNKKEITRGIIMSEILQVPRSKKPFRY